MFFSVKLRVLCGSRFGFFALHHSGKTMQITIHLFSAFWVLIIGAMQLAWPKGTTLHKALGRSWMLAMLIVGISSFWIKGYINWYMGYGPIHLLSIWVMICVLVSVYFIRQGHINRHKDFAAGAFYGSLGAGLAAVLMLGRVLHVFLFG